MDQIRYEIEVIKHYENDEVLRNTKTDYKEALKLYDNFIDFARRNHRNWTITLSSVTDVYKVVSESITIHPSRVIKL